MAHRLLGLCPLVVLSTLTVARLPTSVEVTSRLPVHVSKSGMLKNGGLCSPSISRRVMVHVVVPRFRSAGVSTSVHYCSMLARQHVGAHECRESLPEMQHGLWLWRKSGGLTNSYTATRPFRACPRQTEVLHLVVRRRHLNGMAALSH